MSPTLKKIAKREPIKFVSCLRQVPQAIYRSNQQYYCETCILQNPPDHGSVSVIRDKHLLSVIVLTKDKVCAKCGTTELFKEAVASQCHWCRDAAEIFLATKTPYQFRLVLSQTKETYPASHFKVVSNFWVINCAPNSKPSTS